MTSNLSSINPNSRIIWMIDPIIRFQSIYMMTSVAHNMRSFSGRGSKNHLDDCAWLPACDNNCLAFLDAKLCQEIDKNLRKSVTSIFSSAISIFIFWIIDRMFRFQYFYFKLIQLFAKNRFVQINVHRISAC